MRKQLYKLHRTLSIVIALPVILWAGSGMLHPVMTNIRPEISSQQLEEKPIDSADVVVTLEQVLTSHAIRSFRLVRLVYIHSTLFYQIQRDDACTQYVNAKTDESKQQNNTNKAKYL